MTIYKHIKKGNSSKLDTQIYVFQCEKAHNKCKAFKYVIIYERLFLVCSHSDLPPCMRTGKC